MEVDMLRRGRFLAMCLTLLFTGCALNAVRPPTPAAHLSLDRTEAPPQGEHYYALVWASQRHFRTPAYSHTFATVVHTAEAGPGQIHVLDVHTISWLPATLNIHPFSRHPEPGVNLSLRESLDYARANDERVSLWGPYELRAAAYKRFLVEKDFLETSGVGYQCVDNRGEAARTGNGCNCIHAITDSDADFGRENYPLIWFGDSGSEHLAYRLRDRGAIINPEVEHDEVLTALGLCDEPIRRRRLDDRLINFERVQPGRRFLIDLLGEPRDAPPYTTSPFPPPGPHGS
jgi:hypothetical protein